MGLEALIWSVKWNHSLAIVSNWYIKKSFFQHSIDIILRTGRPISLLAKCLDHKGQRLLWGQAFSFKGYSVMKQIVLFSIMEIISKNAKNIITKFHKK